jgi:hypothetical protein
MITDFEDFCTWMYMLVDDIWQKIAPLYRRPGPEPVGCSDSELMTLAIVGECREWDKETNLLAEWRAYPHLFPSLPERTRFNRRRRHLMFAINHTRQIVLRVLDIAQEQQCVIDSLPVPVVQFHLVPASTGDWDVHDAAFGYCASKKQMIYGYRLHLLITVGGVILDFELTPANVDDRQAATDILTAHRGLTVIGDKAYIDATLAAMIWEQHQIRLITLPRRNQRQQVSPERRRLVNHIRQLIETVNGQLTEHLHIEINHARSFWGLCARLYTKLAAHTLCIYLNRLLGNPDWLQIKALAFPN